MYDIVAKILSRDSNSLIFSTLKIFKFTYMNIHNVANNSLSLLIVAPCHHMHHYEPQREIKHHCITDCKYVLGTR